MPPPSQRRKFPDEAHEAIAVWVEEAIANLGTTRSDVADSLLLADTLFSLIDQTLTDIGTGVTQRGQLQQRITVLEGQVADLLTRVAALEQPLP